LGKHLALVLFKKFAELSKPEIPSIAENPKKSAFTIPPVDTGRLQLTSF
jgi:hypothetical protein